MKYQQPTFSAPVSNGKLTQEEYEVAVGLRQRVTTADLIQRLEDHIDTCLVCGTEIPPGPDFCSKTCEGKAQQ